MKKENLTFFQFALMLLSIISVLMIAVDFTIDMDKEISKVIQIADLVICVFFLYIAFNITHYNKTPIT